MERMNIWVYGYRELCYHFPKVAEKARSTAIRVLDLSSSVPEDILEKHCSKNKIRFFKDGTYFNEIQIMNRCDYNGYTYEDHVRDTIQDALKTYPEGFKPTREDLFTKVQRIDGFIDACKLSEAIIKLGDKCKQDTRKKEIIKGEADIQVNGFYYNLCSFETVKVISIGDNEVTYTYMNRNNEELQTGMERFIEYFERIV